MLILFHNTKLEKFFLIFLCFHGYKNILNNLWPVTNKVLLIPNDLICNCILFISYVRITFKYTGCAIFFNSEKHNESNCTKKIICCYLKNLT
jgi:hypothetical protein